MKPRSDVVVRRFLAGESFGKIAWGMILDRYYVRIPDALAYVESCIRRALNRKKGKR